MSNLSAVVTGAVGSLLVILSSRLLLWLKVDDPVSASAVHGVGGLWSMLATGLMAKKDNLEGYVNYDGLLQGGGHYLLGVQALAAVCCLAWAMVTTAIIIFIVSLCVRFRMRDYEELLGADYVEHNIHRHGLELTRAVSVIGDRHDDILRGHVPVGKNKGHMDYLEHTYSDLATVIKARLRRTGAKVEVQAWSSLQEEDTSPHFTGVSYNQ